MWQIVVSTTFSTDANGMRYFALTDDYPLTVTGPGVQRVTDYTDLAGHLMPPDPAVIAVLVTCHDQATADAINADSTYPTLSAPEETP